MRGFESSQASLFSMVSVEDRVPLGHPLRKIRALADEVLHDLSPIFDRMYADMGRPSIPPERLLKSLRGRGYRVQTLGADRGYHSQNFIDALRRQGVAPRVAAQKRSRPTGGMDGRTLNAAGYALSQRLRKRVEELIGWCKAVGGLKRSRFRLAEGERSGRVARTQQYAHLVGATYNLLRIPKLQEAGA